MIPNRDLLQFVRYLATGVINTLVTLAVIFVCKSLLGVNPWVSNLLGYVAGVVNSFLWNRLWVFHSRSTHWRSEALRFLGGFVGCYLLQFAATWLFETFIVSDHYLIDLHGFTLSGYGIATIFGMLVYTIANFIYNRIITFKAS